ncbi:MAG: ParB/RepB/Spo0J family partition protein [Patescibacteria group bacterium]|nr:ParB/RepB/Spo0J family partition protein [Patescibacteria group bacterium]
MALGRGLNSLIPPKNTVNKILPDFPVTPETAAVLDVNGKILAVPVDEIIANVSQPRRDFSEQSLQDLAESIREHGILQPLVVVKNGSGYELIAGERRLRAAKLAKLDTVPAIIREATAQQKLELALIENIQREDLNPIEVALSMQKLSDEFNLSQDSIAKRLGKPRSSVANIFRLLNLPEEMQKALSNGSISEGHAKILLGVDSPIKQQVLFKKILANKMSVGATMEETRRSGGTKRAQVIAPQADGEKESILREFFGTKINLKRVKNGGQIVITFYSDDELNEILKKIK